VIAQQALEFRSRDIVAMPEATITRVLQKLKSRIGQLAQVGCGD
jgi:hypothetical protein